MFGKRNGNNQPIMAILSNDDIERLHIEVPASSASDVKSGRSYKLISQREHRGQKRLTLESPAGNQIEAQIVDGLDPIKLAKNINEGSKVVLGRR